jgi:hypothetical protein
MDINYKWSVKSIYTLPSPPAPIDNFAVTIEYSVFGVNPDNVSASIDGAIQLPIDQDSKNFTPYDKLTEEQVLTWIQSEPNLKENAESNILGQIMYQINPPIVPEKSNLPWNLK